MIKQDASRATKRAIQSLDLRTLPYVTAPIKASAAGGDPMPVEYSDPAPGFKEVKYSEIASPAMGSLRTVWLPSIADGLTPGKLNSILKEAETWGHHLRYLTLAEEMEERDPHLLGCLNVRKTAVTRLPITVEAASESEQDKQYAKEIMEITKTSQFVSCSYDLLDGLMKGYSVCEVMWDFSRKPWVPKQFIWRDPRFFIFDINTGSKIRLITMDNAAFGMELTPERFIVHVPKIKSGIPARGGLAKPISWCFLFKHWAIKDWQEFLDLFGMPFRVGTFKAGSTPEDVSRLEMALETFGHMGWMVLPETISHEMQVPHSSAASSEIFQHLAEFMDKQVALAVLGTTALTEPTPGKLGAANEQEKIRLEIRDSDAVALANTYNDQLVKAYIDLNYGPQKKYPRIVISEIETKDVEKLVKSVVALLPFGLTVRDKDMQEILKLKAPQEGDVLLKAPPKMLYGNAGPGGEGNNSGGGEGNTEDNPSGDAEGDVEPDIDGGE